MTDSFRHSLIKTVSDRLILSWRHCLAFASTCIGTVIFLGEYIQRIRFLTALKTYFSELKNIMIRNKRPRKVNCWFCNQDTYLTTDVPEDWICPNCQQYNGFSQDGDYIHPIKEQFDVKNYKTNTVCSSSDFDTSKTVLCNVCSQNQVLKVRQLAAFTPFNEASYDEEVEIYRGYLEDIYSLCDKCQERLKELVGGQDQTLLKNMKSSQLELLETVARKQNKEQIHPVQLNEPGKPILPFSMFFLCFLTALLHVVLLLRQMAASGAHSPNKYSYLGQVISSLVTIIPPKLALGMEEFVVSTGAVLCIVGLFAVGKYSLYPEDAVHLLLWLVSMVTTSNTFAASLPWLSASSEMMMAVSVVTLSVSLLCCIRNRQPRHFTAVSIHKKDLRYPTPTGQSLALESQHGNRGSNSGKGDVSQSSKPTSSPMCVTSTVHSEKNGQPQFENVRQDLESFSLGLGKKSSSTSSIWSLPAVVTSSTDSDMAPDSSTDHPSHNPGHARSVLSPSRLGFLTFELGSSSRTGSSSDLSRSPSPWSPVSPDSNSAIYHHGYTHQVPQIHSSASFDPGHNSSSGLIRPVVNRFSPCMSTCNHPSYTPPGYMSLFNNSASKPRASNSDSNLGPCDSQTLIGTRFEDTGLNSKASHRQTSHSGGRLVDNTSLFQQCLQQQNVSDSNEHQKGPRRSQRIALFGRPQKPWPLKKSLSCNNAYDVKNLEKAGRATRSDNSSGFLPVRNSKNSYNNYVSPLEELPEVPDLAPDQNTKFPNSHSIMRTNMPIQSQHTLDSHQISQKVTSSKSDKKKKLRNKRMSEFSDDEDVDGMSDRTDRVSTNGLRQDSSWQWILLGLVIGTSITTNIFLMSQGWLSQH